MFFAVDKQTTERNMRDFTLPPSLWMAVGWKPQP